MAMYRQDITADGVADAMLSGLQSHVKEALRARFQKEADVVIEEAIAAAMETFGTAVRTFHAPEKFEDVVQVLLTDKRSK